MGVGVKDIGSKAELEDALLGVAPVVLHFWASWCAASKQMDQVFAHLAAEYPQVLFFRVEAEEQPEISEEYAVSAVPCFVFCKDGKKVDTLEGADPPSLANKVAKVAGSDSLVKSSSPANIEVATAPIETVKKPSEENGSSHNDSTSSDLNDALRMRLQQLVDSHPVFLFMKGSPEEPKCGFSRKVVDILKDEGVKFGSFNILMDNEVREGMKKFSNWPTFPQLFCKGEFVGGCDIAVAMHESGELKDLFTEHGIPVISQETKVVESAKDTSSSDASAPIKSEALSDPAGLSDALSSRLHTLTNSSPVMVFMKGKPDEPKCGFSRKVIEILRQEKVAFDSFDILSDEEVRQGLKIFSNWPSYPQLYIGGELIGGSDIVLEMQKSGELKKLLVEKDIIQDVTPEDRLKNLITSSPVMLFMKGTPDAPRCGFSSKVVDALRKEEINFGSFDILSNDEVRQGLKTYSNWPTYPQLYYKGELIGGCDIVLEMQRNGELKSTLSE
ncbi:monothiol glutaredoxin-S11 [Canna indica]|uniref:Monothiol glutaredoxin-S11 n=1 Tax=Canna indica TaxID=4628 RepID=A0AAQ3KQI3_9LILI|nr:monothiol glutaredoxin-S11 [Canna indica]